jgi:hypothetical protein
MSEKFQDLTFSCGRAILATHVRHDFRYLLGSAHLETKESLMGGYILILLTLIVATIGIYLPDRKEYDPKDSSRKSLYRYAPHILFLLAVASSAASLHKEWQDDDDKKFLQRALTSTLVPTHSGYDGFYQDFDALVAAQGFVNDSYPCHHSDDGLVCFFVSLDGSKHGTLVLEKGEIAQMYANQLHGQSNRAISEALFKKQFTPSKPNEEFLDKAGIVGFLTFYNIYGKFPANYYYDPSYGVKVISDKGEVVISPDDMRRIPAGSGLDVFRKIEELYRERFKAAGASAAN